MGKGKGKEFNVNIPWDASGLGDADYMFAMKQVREALEATFVTECIWQVVGPIAAEFRPDLVLVSAGFDAAKGDPFGQCNVSPGG